MDGEKLQKLQDLVWGLLESGAAEDEITDIVAQVAYEWSEQRKLTEQESDSDG